MEWEKKTAKQYGLSPRRFREYLAAAEAIQKYRTDPQMAENPPLPMAIIKNRVEKIPAAVKNFIETGVPTPPRKTVALTDQAQLKAWRKQWTQKGTKIVEEAELHHIPTKYLVVLCKVLESLIKKREDKLNRFLDEIFPPCDENEVAGSSPEHSAG